MKKSLPSLLLAFLHALTVNAADIVWTNTSGGNWSVPANWEPNQTPGGGDTAVITNVGTYTVILDVSASIDSLTLGGASGNQTLTNGGSSLLADTVAINTNGILDLSAGGVQSISLTVNGLLDWSGGVLLGALTVAANSMVNWSGGTLGNNSSLTVATNGVLNLTGSNPKILGANAALTNAGAIYWSGTGDIQTIQFNYYITIHNLPGGVFEAQSDQTCSFQGHFFLNDGLFRKTDGTGTTSIYIPFINTGTVEAQTGTINFNMGGSLGGLFAASNSAVINFAAETFTLISGNPASTGAVQFTSGASITFSGPITNFNFTAGVLRGNNLVTGTMNWSAGTLGGNESLTVASNGVLNLTGGSSKFFGPNAALTNAGAIYWSGAGDIQTSQFNYYSTIHNLPGGVFEAQSDQTCSFSAHFFLNDGLFRKSGSSGTTTIYIPFINTGTVEAQNGTINLAYSYSNGPSANLAVSLGGITPSSDYGHIHFTSPLGMDGTFTVTTRNGFVPSPGDTFNVLSYPSATNEFACLSGLDLGGGVLLLPEYDPTVMSLVATAYTLTNAQPELFITRSPTGVRLTWPVGFPGWGLQSNTNLSSTNWSSVPVQCDGQAVMSVIAPQQYFRLSNTN